MKFLLLKLLELSLQAGLLTIVILLVRLVFKKLPAKYLCILWAVVAARLIIPVSYESGFGLMPSLSSFTGRSSQEAVYESFEEESEYRSKSDYYIGEISSGDETDYYITITEEELRQDMDKTDTHRKPMDSGGESDHYIVTVSPTPVPEGIAGIVSEVNYSLKNITATPILFFLWIVGVVFLLGYGIRSCVKVKRFVKNAIPYEDNIRLVEGLQTPFLFGWRHPQIFLPTNLEEVQIRYVVEHENAHIARGDNYTKLLGFVLLSVYWFNPLIWVAYITFCKDVEKACDEKVISGLSAEDRKGYAEALLKCSVDNNKVVISNPLAFGKTDVKHRITGILKYKKPGRWLAVLAILLCLAAAAGCFLVQKESGNGAGSTATAAPTQIPTATATPTPTAGVTGLPEATPKPRVTPTPLPPSDLSLLGNCTAETVLPVPFGQTVTVDLDGDGMEDSVTFGLEGYEGNVSLHDLEEAHIYTYEKVEDLYYLQINDRRWTQPEIEEEFWSHYGVGTTTYYIFDVDTSDKYKEIGIFFPGPNTPTGIALYRYFNGELYCIGNFMSAVLEADHGYDTNRMPYEEMVAEVNREGYLITVPGDGTILCEERKDCLETSFSVVKYKLDSASSGRYAQLREVARERYEFSGWQNDRGEFNVRAAKAFYVYLEPVDMSQEFHKDLLTVKIPEGTRISFVAFYPDNEWTAGWVQFAYGENLENFAWLYKGVDPRGKSMIYLPTTTESNPDDLFENLSKAG